MALATKCPHCHTVFRVALDQLKLRGGIVRCGACNEIFDGNAALMEPAASAAGSAIPVLMPTPVVPAGLDLELELDEGPMPVREDQARGASHATGFAVADDPVSPSPARAEEPEPEALPEPALPEPDPEPVDTRREAAFDMPSEHIVAAALDDLHHFDDAPEPVTPPPTLHDTREDTAVPEVEDDVDNDEPEFVRQAYRRERTKDLSRLAMSAGIPLLVFVLLIQGVYTLRNRLAADHPTWTPALKAICAPLGCTVELPRQIDALAIEQGELQTLAPNTFSFVTVLRNGSRSVQAWPHIELVLNDAADKPVLRRVFAPRDYLPRSANVAQGFGPRSEQSVKLYFELDRLRAAGYHIAIFHP